MRFHDPAVRSEHEHLLGNLVAEMRAFDWTEATCPVCDANSTRPALEKWGITVCRCEGCGHLFVSPRMPREAVPALYGSRYWHAHALATGCPPLAERVLFDYENAQTKLDRDVLPFRSGGRLLDVGASNGGFVRRASEQGFAAVGLEPSAEICALARSAHRVEMHCGTLLDDLFEPESFDEVPRKVYLVESTCCHLVTVDGSGMESSSFPVVAQSTIK